MLEPIPEEEEHVGAASADHFDMLHLVEPTPIVAAATSRPLFWDSGSDTCVSTNVDCDSDSDYAPSSGGFNSDDSMSVTTIDPDIDSYPIKPESCIRLVKQFGSRFSQWLDIEYKNLEDSNAVRSASEDTDLANDTLAFACKLLNAIRDSSLVAAANE
jgi:hypothetical protein